MGNEQIKKIDKSKANKITKPLIEIVKCHL
jgi:hypothetical protein